MSRYTVITVHGEGRSLFHVVDSLASTDDQPAILYTDTDPQIASGRASMLNLAAQPPRRRGVQRIGRRLRRA